MDDSGLLLTSGAYIASDANVQVTSKVQTRLNNSLLSGAGFFLLKAIGQGYVACGAYGASHKFTLREAETRAVDNGHLIAWSAHMKYSVELASGRGRISNSMASGEGLMCFFEGPGVVYVQSHKPDSIDGISQKTPSTTRPVYPCCSLIAAVVAFSIYVAVTLWPFIQVVEPERLEEFQNEWGLGEF